MIFLYKKVLCALAHCSQLTETYLFSQTLARLNGAYPEALASDPGRREEQWDVGPGEYGDAIGLL